MGIFSGLKNFFSGGNKALKPKAATNYNGTSTTRFYGQKFPGGLPYPTPTLTLDSAGIRQQVRTLSHSSLQLRAMIENDVDTVIAQGLNFAPEPKHEILGITPEAAEEWAGDVAMRFEMWAMSPKASRNGGRNFFQAQRLMEKCLRRDGELFVALSYHNDPGLISPLRFEILDPDQIRESAFTWTANGETLNPMNREGIIRNADGEEVAYKVWTKDAHGLPKMTTIPKVGRGGRIMMLHAMTDTDYAGQLRGISPYAVCVQDLEHILDFTLAQVNKAINQSNVAFTTDSSTDKPAEDPFKNLSLAGSGPAAMQYGNSPEPDPEAKNVTEESLKPVYNEVPHGNFNRPGSYGVFSLPGGQKLNPFPNTSPSQAFNAFVDNYFAYIAAATRRSVETVLMRFNANYSASRATLILTWRIAVQQRWELDYHVLGPISEMWLAEEIAAGRVSAPGWLDPRLRAAWTAHRFNGLAMPNIDPRVTMAAAKDALSLGATTLDEVSIEHNDSDAKSNRTKLKKELEELRELGPMPWASSNSMGTATEEKDDKAQQEDGGE